MIERSSLRLLVPAGSLVLLLMACSNDSSVAGVGDAAPRGSDRSMNRPVWCQVLLVLAKDLP